MESGRGLWKVGVAYGKWAWLMKNNVWLRRWSNKSIERSLSGFPSVCVCACALRVRVRVRVRVCVCVSATRGSTAQTSKPIIFQMVVLQK